nr:hypothetical protein [Elusimicrobiota bacterium]
NILFLILFLVLPAHAGITNPHLENTLISSAETGLIYDNYSFGTSFYGYKEDISFENCGLKLRVKPGIILNYIIDISAGRAEVDGRKTSPGGIYEFKIGVEGALSGDIEVFNIWKWGLSAGGQKGNFNSFGGGSIDIDYSRGFVDLTLYASKKYNNITPYLGAAFSYSLDRYRETITGISSSSRYSGLSVIYGFKYRLSSNFYIQAGAVNLNDSGFYIDIGKRYL